MGIDGGDHGWCSKGRGFDSHCGQAYFSSLPGVDIHSECSIFMHNTVRFFIQFSPIQIKMPADFLEWHESMCAEFPTRFNRLFRGPMWSGVDKEHHGYPIKVS